MGEVFHPAALDLQTSLSREVAPSGLEGGHYQTVNTLVSPVCRLPDRGAVCLLCLSALSALSVLQTDQLLLGFT